MSICHPSYAVLLIHTIPSKNILITSHINPLIEKIKYELMHIIV